MSQENKKKSKGEQISCSHNKKTAKKGGGGIIVFLVVFFLFSRGVCAKKTELARGMKKVVASSRCDRVPADCTAEKSRIVATGE